MSIFLSIKYIYFFFFTIKEFTYIYMNHHSYNMAQFISQKLNPKQDNIWHCMIVMKVDGKL